MLSAIQNFIKRHGGKDWFCLVFVGLAAAAVMLPLPLFGIPDGNDLPQHLRFAATFHEAILSGDFFPGWAAADNYGFGSIGIRYYPPAAYYLMAFTQLLTGNWYETFWINSFFWMFLGCAGIYFWAKEWLSPWPAVFAGALYSIIPYHSSQIYQYLLYAEFAASGILPFCFLFATRIIKRGKSIDVLLLSISCSLLLLAHIPLTIIGSIGLGIYVLLLMDWRKAKKTLLNFMIAAGLSLSATAFHWLRALSEVEWVKHNSTQYYANGYYDYNKYFFPMIYNAGETYHARLLWHLDITIILSFLLILPLLVYLLLRIKSDNENSYFDRKILYTLSVTGLFSLFIMSQTSAFIWNSITVLQKIQFPWRWLSLTSLIGVMAFTFAVPLLISRYENFKKPINYAAGILVFLILIFNITQVIIPFSPLQRDKFEDKLAEMRRDPGCSCWWPVWANSKAFERREKVYAESRAADVTLWDREIREFTVEKGSSENVRAATFYHPFWKAEVNGQPVEIQKADDGSILIPVPTDKSLVRLYFEEPRKLNIALGISLLTWLFLFGALLTTYRNRQKPQISV